MKDSTTHQGQWSQIAKNWELIGPPLRPSAEDVAAYAGVLTKWQDRHPVKAPRGLILGVTPELHGLPWSDRDMIYAVDRNAEMIQYVWPGNRDQVLHCDWRDIPLEPGSVDIVMCDGGLTSMPGLEAQRDLARRLACLVAPGGRVAFRLFVPPLLRETPDAVLADLFDGRIRDLNCLKLRLGWALTGPPEDGVSLHEVWSFLHDRAGTGGWGTLARKLGWSVQNLEAIDAYRFSAARYYFVDEESVVATFEVGTVGLFKLDYLIYGSYEFGECCPLIVFERI